MGLLDDLEQAATRRRQEQDEQSRQKEQRELVFRTELDPAMQALQDFLNRLIEPLTALKPERIVQYELPGYGALVAQVVHEYQLDGAATSTMREITLRFVALLLTERCPQIDASGATRVKTVASALQKVHLGGLLNPRKDHTGEVVEASFRAKGKIPLSVHFIADAASGQVRVTFSNFEDLSAFTKVYAPAQFNEELFEIFARYITREDNGLTKEAISDRVRNSLRTKVQQEEIRRKFEERMYQKQQDEERERAEAADIGLRIRKQGGALFDKLKLSISGLIAKVTKKP
jgi:hypothetical protein